METNNSISSIKEAMLNNQNTKYHKYIDFAKQLANGKDLTSKQQSDLISLLSDLGLSAEQLDFDARAVKARKYIEQVIEDAPGMIKELTDKQNVVHQVIREKEATIIRLQNELVKDREHLSGILTNGQYSKYYRCHDVYNTLLQATSYHDEPKQIEDIINGKHESIRGWLDGYGLPLSKEDTNDIDAALVYGDAIGRVAADELIPLMNDLFKAEELKQHKRDIAQAEFDNGPYGRLRDSLQQDARERNEAKKANQLQDIREWESGK